jgi:hypothetical protein
MPVETDSDRAVFIDDDDFAVPVSWVHAGGTATFSAIFDAEYQLITSAFLDGGVEGSGPQILARSTDIPALAKQGDSVTVKATVYTAVEFKPDGTGMTIVRLQES